MRVSCIYENLISWHKNGRCFDIFNLSKKDKTTHQSNLRGKFLSLILAPCFSILLKIIIFALSIGSCEGVSRVKNKDISRTFIIYWDFGGSPRFWAKIEIALFSRSKRFSPRFLAFFAKNIKIGSSFILKPWNFFEKIKYSPHFAVAHRNLWPIRDAIQLIYLEILGIIFVHCSGDSCKDVLKTIHSSDKSLLRLLKFAFSSCLFISMKVHNVLMKIFLDKSRHI